MSLALEAVPTRTRYGENPHQLGLFLGPPADAEKAVFKIVAANETRGKGEPSYNNLLDLDAAIGLMADFLDDGPTVAVLKHGIPCAMATAGTLAEAWTRAIAVDPKSPFGGVAIFNMPIDAATAALVAGLYLDIVAAPGFAPGVIQALAHKTRVQVLKWELPRVVVRSALGGLLVHERDVSLCTDAPAAAAADLDAGGRTVRQWTVVTPSAHPDIRQTVDLLYAERVCKHVKSNAVVVVKERRLLGAGASQPCRVGATEVALQRATSYPVPPIDMRGAVVASDAYFPFPDGVEAAIAAGVVAIVQPGGSRNDAASIAAADAAGVAMVLTGIRHFRH
jgi:phosphoribosylaminoimidazolecarboxamide formyltransferase/IMP cyclohydrolase